MFNSIGTNGQEYKNLLKYLIETYAQSVSGIDFNYTLEAGDMPIGYDGQNLPVPTQTKRSAVNPSFVFTELLGGLIWKFFNFWIKCIQDPDTNISLASALLTDVSATNNATAPAYDPVTSSWSMSFMAIQPDTTMRPENVLDAAFYTAAFPTDCGEFGFQKAVGSTAIKERTVNFRAVVQHNTNTMYYGKEIMRILNFHKLDYSYSTVRAKIDTAFKDVGLQQDLDIAVEEFKATKNNIVGLKELTKETLYSENPSGGGGN
jgi:hypothetical protein